MKETESTSRIPGFYKLSLDERRALIASRAKIPAEELEALESGGLSPTSADKVVENVLGVYALPFGLALNVQINGVDRLVPMVVEEPSVIAAASNAAKMTRSRGGFRVEQLDDLMISQVQLYDVPDVPAACEAIEAAREELMTAAEAAMPGLVPYGGGPRGMELRPLEGGMLVVHLLVDCRDAMGANLVNSLAERLGPRLAELANGQLGLRILSNLSDRRRVRASCRIAVDELALKRPTGAVSGREVAQGVELASRFAEADPYRAATHNKGIMNGIDSVVIATGNDYRAVEAGAHAYAARNGRYEPLATWRLEGDDLVGQLELPLALGIVGGTLRVHPTARLALRLLGVERASELCQAAAAVGLASNLAALRALATEGIQRGHMSLHARSVAVSAGAEEDEVERVAAALVDGGNVSVDEAARHLETLRAERDT